MEAGFDVGRERDGVSEEESRWRVNREGKVWGRVFRSCNLFGYSLFKSSLFIGRRNRSGTIAWIIPPYSDQNYVILSEYGGIIHALDLSQFTPPFHYEIPDPD